MTNEDRSTPQEALGQALKAFRLKAGVDLDRIVEETKVSKMVFEALEEGRYHLLPQRVFCRNFLKQYLRIVGGDVKPWLVDFEQAWDDFESTSGTFPILEIEEPPGGGVNWRLWAPVIGGAIVILTLVSVVILSARSGGDLPPDPRRSSAARATPTHHALSTPTPFALSGSALPVETPTANPMVAFEIRVLDDRECWIHYRDREGRTGQELLLGGAVKEMELTGPAVLTLGNADAASIVVGDREYEQLGRAGQVAHFQVSPDGLTRLDPRDNGR